MKENGDSRKNVVGGVAETLEGVSRDGQAGSGRMTARNSWTLLVDKSKKIWENRKNNYSLQIYRSEAFI